MKKKYKSYIKLEKKGSAIYGYEMFPYYDKATKNTKYSKKIYLGKLVGYNPDGSPIFKKVRGGRKMSSEKSLLWLESVLDKDSYYKRIIREYTKAKARELA